MDHDAEHDPRRRDERPTDDRHSARPDGEPAALIDVESGAGLRIFAILLALLFLLVAGATAASGEPLTAATETAATALPTESGAADATEDPAQPTLSPIQKQVRGALGTLPRGSVQETARSFYEARDYRPAWLDGGPAGALLASLSEAQGLHGLDPAAYDLERLRRQLEGGGTARASAPADPAERARLEVALTGAWISYANDLLRGRLSPEEVEGTWHLQSRERDLAQALERAVASRDVAGSFRDLEPSYERYHALQEQYRRYRRLAEDGGWPQVPDGPILEEGDEVEPERYRALVNRLAAEGHLSTSAARDRLARLDAAAQPREGRLADRPTNRSTTRQTERPERSGSERSGEPSGEASQAPSASRYDADLARAVLEFQDRHGIREDSKVGPNTMEQMNVRAEERADQIALNLERWRWLPADLGERHVEVNLPGFTLRAVEDGRVAQTMEVVVGKEGWETPVFSETMERVVVNPYWNIPDNIVRADLLPEIRQGGAGYLASRDMEVVDLSSGDVIPASRVNWSSLGGVRVRQRPGPNNALGQIKFLFPNEFNVYLHDTPAESAFERKYRDLSHGCVRLERPVDFAGFVFAGNPEWTPARVQRAIDSREHQVIELDETLPVHFLYWTAFVDRQGRMNFRPDLYGYDAAHGEALERASQVPGRLSS